MYLHVFVDALVWLKLLSVPRLTVFIMIGCFIFSYPNAIHVIAYFLDYCVAFCLFILMQCLCALVEVRTI